MCRDHDFKTSELFYRFVEDEKDRGHTIAGESWHSVLPDLAGEQIKPIKLGELLKGRSDLVEKGDPDHVPNMLFDEYNCDLFD